MDIYKIANEMKLSRKTIFDLNIRVTYYARVSTTREEQENSVESQMMFFEEMIKNNDNWTYVNGYVDRIRGETAANRDQFMQMIEDGKNGKFDLILTKEVSRFARDTIDSLTYTRDLYRAGVGVFFQNDNICTIDTDSEMRLTIMSSIAADEVRKLSERVKWGHKRSIERGAVLGNSRIFGYDKRDCKLVVNDSEAEMVRMIFDLYSTGDYSTRKIERILFDKGYRGRNGTKIQHNTIKGIITNPKYKGYYCGHKVCVTDYRTKAQQFLPESEWVVYKDETGEVVPAIVEESVWDKCNEIMRERGNAIRNRGRSFKDSSVFTGKIWCASHDEPYWRTSYSNSASQGKPVYQWVCRVKKRESASACQSFAIMEEELYEMLAGLFKNMISNIDDYINTFLNIYELASADNGSEREMISIKAKIERERRKKEKLLELYMDESISKQEFTERNDSANIVISDLEKCLKEISDRSTRDREYAAELSKIKLYLSKAYNDDDTAAKFDREHIDEMTKALIDRIEVSAVDKKTMSLCIKLKTGQKEKLTYVRNGSRYARRSGLISNIMNPEQQWQFQRHNRRECGHKFEATYIIYIGI